MTHAGGEEGFRVAIMSFWNARVPRQSRIAIAAREINFAEPKIRLRPVWFEARGFAQFAEANIVLAGEQAADVMFKGIEAQRALLFREFGEAQRIRVIARGEGAPGEARLQIHQGVQWPGLANHGKQR